jgi:hypothetical protein
MHEASPTRLVEAALPGDLAAREPFVALRCEVQNFRAFGVAPKRISPGAPGKDALRKRLVPATGNRPTRLGDVEKDRTLAGFFSLLAQDLEPLDG